MDYVTLLREQAQKRGSAVSLIWQDRSYTYSELCEAVQHFVLPAWREQLPRDYKTAVLIRTTDLYHQLVAFLGIMAAGQIPIIGHFDLPPLEEEKLVAKNKIGFVLAEEGGAWVLTKKTEEAAEETSFSAAGSIPAKASCQNACMGVLSSGSADTPKVMYRTYESWGGFFPEQNRRFAIDSVATVLVEGSFSFTGNLSIWASCLFAGCTLVVSDALNGREWLRMIETYQVTTLYLIPVKLKLLNRLARNTYPQVKTILAGSQLLGAAAAKKLKKAFPASEIILYYGASELNYISWLTFEEVLRYPDSVGKAVPGVQIWSENGLIYVNTPYHVEGLTQPCTLLDAGYFNEAGYLIFEGRKSRIINKGGFKVNCAKVENALNEIKGVAEAVVLPYEDERKGQELAAFVVGERNLTAGALRQNLKSVLMPQELPKKFFFLPMIPLNSCGKTDKNALLKQLKGPDTP